MISWLAGFQISSSAMPKKIRVVVSTNLSLRRMREKLKSSSCTKPAKEASLKSRQLPLLKNSTVTGFGV
jgi:hypothetical protein